MDEFNSLFAFSPRTIAETRRQKQRTLRMPTAKTSFFSRIVKFILLLCLRASQHRISQQFTCCSSPARYQGIHDKYSHNKKGKGIRSKMWSWLFRKPDLFFIQSGGGKISFCSRIRSKSFNSAFLGTEAVCTKKAQLIEFEPILLQIFRPPHWIQNWPALRRTLFFRVLNNSSRIYNPITCRQLVVRSTVKIFHWYFFLRTRPSRNAIASNSAFNMTNHRDLLRIIEFPILWCAKRMRNCTFLLRKFCSRLSQQLPSTFSNESRSGKPSLSVSEEERTRYVMYIFCWISFISFHLPVTPFFPLVGVFGITPPTITQDSIL